MNETEILQQILLPSSSDWEVFGVSVDDTSSTVIVDLRYLHAQVSFDSVSYPIYDYRDERLWRHLDLWHYKTFLRARIPRYTKDGKVVSLAVPWSEESSRMTTLLEKKR